MDLADAVAGLRSSSGDRRAMGMSAVAPDLPHYHLVRKFKGENDLLIILNTKRCSYNCSFCDLPAKSTTHMIESGQISSQFLFAMQTYREMLHILDRVTISNEGSVLDATTFPEETLVAILAAVDVLPGVGRVVLETRPEYVTAPLLAKLKEAFPGTIDLLMGLETIDDRLRNVTLGKRQTREAFEKVFELARMAGRVEATFYVLLKSDYRASDRAAAAEARRTIQWIADASAQSGVRASVRLNPMYIARGTRWAVAAERAQYQPPRLDDALALAEWAEGLGVSSYIGLSTEGLAGTELSYRGRDDFNRDVFRRAVQHNLRRGTIADA